jgi:hypothetical protein
MIRFGLLGCGRIAVCHAYLLAGNHIDCPVAWPFLPAYCRFGPLPQQFACTHLDQRTTLSLPMFAKITPEQQRTAIDLVREF